MRRANGLTEPVEWVDPQLRLLDAAVCVLLIALLAFLPFAMATHEGWNTAIASALAFGGAAALAVKLIARPEQRFVWTWSYLPIALLLGYVALQMTPLPIALVRALSPQSVVDRMKMLADLPAALKPGHFTLSFDALGTWETLQLVIVSVTVFVVAVNITRQPWILKLLLWSIAIIGTAEAALAIAQTLSGASGIYWVFPLPDMRPEAGTFPNHNFFSQFMNLSAGATLALLLLSLDETFRRHDYTPAEMLEKLSSRTIRPGYFLMAMLVVEAVSVVLSLSRGGMIAMLVGGLFVALLLALRGGRRGMGVTGWFAGLIIVCAFSFVLASGYGLVEKRIARIGNQEDRYDRMRLSRDALHMWSRYPMVGTGLGTFVYAFPRFDTSHINVVAMHAEDEYVEWLAELGIVGGAMVVAFGGMIAASFFAARARGRRGAQAVATPGETHRHRPGDAGHPGSEKRMATREHSAAGELAEAPEHSGEAHGGRSAGHRRQRGHISLASPLSIGIGFGLMAVLVQSATDFAPQFLPVSCLIAIFCGMIVNLAAVRRKERGLAIERDTVPARSTLMLRRLARSSAIVVFLLAVAVPVCLGRWRRWQADDDQARVDAAVEVIRPHNWENVDGEAVNLIRYADAAAGAEPRDVAIRFWQQMYHWIMAPPSLKGAQKRQFMEKLAADLQRLRLICPSYGKTDSLLGQIEFNDLDAKEAGEREIELSLWLAPSDPNINLICGLMDCDLARWNEAVGHFKDSIALDPENRGDVMRYLVDDYQRPDLVLQVAGNEVDGLRMAATVLRHADAVAGLPPPDDADAATVEPGVGTAGAGAAGATTATTTGPTTAVTTGPTTAATTGPALSVNERWARRADRLADEELEREAAEPEASGDLDGKMAMLLLSHHEPVKALKYFDLAILKGSAPLYLRMLYSRTLLQTGHDREALEQVRRVLNQQEWNSDAQSLQESILVHGALRHAPDTQPANGD